MTTLALLNRGVNGLVFENAYPHAITQIHTQYAHTHTHTHRRHTCTLQHITGVTVFSRSTTLYRHSVYWAPPNPPNPPPPPPPNTRVRVYTISTGVFSFYLLNHGQATKANKRRKTPTANIKMNTDRVVPPPGSPFRSQHAVFSPTLFLRPLYSAVPSWPSGCWRRQSSLKRQRPARKLLQISSTLTTGWSSTSPTCWRRQLSP